MLQWSWKFPRARKHGVGAARKCGIAAFGLLGLVVPLSGAVASDEVVESPPSDTAAADAVVELPQAGVSLDRLLTLPSAMPIESSERGGRTRADWSSRFSEARAEVVSAQEDLDEALDRLSEVVGKTSNWKVAAPGAGQANPNDNSPTNYGLKQEVRGKREDLERAERQLRDLSVKANLAGVPEDWYERSE
jgi:hypothetical protein